MFPSLLNCPKLDCWIAACGWFWDRHISHHMFRICFRHVNNNYICNDKKKHQGPQRRWPFRDSFRTWCLPLFARSTFWSAWVRLQLAHQNSRKATHGTVTETHPDHGTWIEQNLPFPPIMEVKNGYPPSTSSTYLSNTDIFHDQDLWEKGYNPWDRFSNPLIWLGCLFFEQVGYFPLQLHLNFWCFAYRLLSSQIRLSSPKKQHGSPKNHPKVYKKHHLLPRPSKGCWNGWIVKGAIL